MTNLLCRWCKKPVGRTWMHIQGYGYLHLAGNAGEKPNCYQDLARERDVMLR